MVTHRAATGMAAINGKIYAIGGTEDSKDALSSGEVLDLKTMKWKALPEMATPRMDFGERAALWGRVWLRRNTREWVCRTHTTIAAQRAQCLCVYYDAHAQGSLRWRGRSLRVVAWKTAVHFCRVARRCPWKRCAGSLFLNCRQSGQ